MPTKMAKKTWKRETTGITMINPVGRETVAMRCRSTVSANADLPAAWE